MDGTRQEIERVIDAIAVDGNVSVYFWANRLQVSAAVLREVAEAHGYTAYGEQMLEARRRGITLAELDVLRGVRGLLGEDNPNWRGGKKAYRARVDKLRASSEYKKWRQAVQKRDEETCNLCGGKRTLHPHHKASKSKYPELMYDVRNGITLCAVCHLGLDIMTKRRWEREALAECGHEEAEQRALPLGSRAGRPRYGRRSR